MQVQKILLSRPDRIGDVILSTPCIKPLREKYPDAEIHLLVQKHIEPLVKGIEALNGVMYMPAKNEVNFLVKLFERKSFDAVVHLHPSEVVEEAASKAGIKRRIGFTMHKSEWLTDALPYLKKEGDKHEAEFPFDLLELLDVKKPSEFIPELNLAPASADSFQKKMPENMDELSMVVMHVGAYGEKPRIPLEYFVETANKVLEDEKNTIVLTGDRADDDSVNELLSQIDKSRVINLSGKLNLAELGQLLLSAKAFLSRDTGPAHLAAALGCPTVTVFMQPSPTMSSRRWKPLGPDVFIIEKELKQRWFEGDHKYARRHMNKISPEEIYSELKKAMAVSRKSNRQKSAPEKSRMKFAELDLKPELMRALEEIGYEELTPIQEAVFKHIIAGKDVVGIAETGSGKTSACGVPIVQMIDTKENTIQGLVLVPTRELALQYVEEISKLSHYADINCFAMFGGFPMSIQNQKLQLGVHILVATPGRLIDCIYNSEHLSLKHVKTLILDEADKMLNMGFWEEVEFILSCMRQKHQTLLFSATMPREIETLVESFVDNPERVKLTAKQRVPNSLEHQFKSVHPRERLKELRDYIKSNKTGQTIIFCNSRGSANDLYKELRGSMKSLDLIHGGLDQNARTSIFNRFKSGKVQYMIATDVAGRGLDFSAVTHVINYELSRELESYTHRTGRAGRMGRKGVAVTFITRHDEKMLNRILKEHRIKPKWIGKPLKSGNSGPKRGPQNKRTNSGAKNRPRKPRNQKSD